MPYMFGWHPGFNLPTNEGQDTEDYELALGVDKVFWTPLDNGNFFTDAAVDYKLSNGSYLVNTDEIYPNDTMIFTGHKNEARMFAKGHSYELNMIWSENLPTLCLWKEPVDEVKFLCVEPWCEFNKDGVDDDNFDKRRVPRLLPGEAADYFFKFKVKE